MWYSGWSVGWRRLRRPGFKSLIIHGNSLNISDIFKTLLRSSPSVTWWHIMRRRSRMGATANVLPLLAQRTAEKTWIDWEFKECENNCFLQIGHLSAFLCAVYGYYVVGWTLLRYKPFHSSYLHCPPSSLKMLPLLFPFHPAAELIRPRVFDDTHSVCDAVAV